MIRRARQMNTKRISLMIGEEQLRKLHETGANISGLVRDLIDDHLSEHKITISVTEETRNLYNQIISRTGSSDTEIEPYLKKSLKEMLKNRIKEMERLHKSLA